MASTTKKGQLAKMIERWQIATWWGQRRRIKPRLVARIFGDGKRLLALAPMMFRPNHFVVRIDSKTDTMEADEWVDEIYRAIEEEFYEWPWARAYGLRWHQNESAERDSRINFDDGATWWELEWPQSAKVEKAVAP